MGANKLKQQVSSSGKGGSKMKNTADQDEFHVIITIITIIINILK